MMDYDEVDKVIQKLAKLAFMSDNRCRYLVEMPELDRWIVNCDVSDECPAELAEDRALRLAKIIELVLREWYPPVEKGWSWFLYGEPNYWTANGNLTNEIDSVKPGGVVQWCILKESE